MLRTYRSPLYLLAAGRLRVGDGHREMPHLPVMSMIGRENAIIEIGTGRETKKRKERGRQEGKNAERGRGKERKKKRGTEKGRRIRTRRRALRSDIAMSQLQVLVAQP